MERQSTDDEKEDRGSSALREQRVCMACQEKESEKETKSLRESKSSLPKAFKVFRRATALKRPPFSSKRAVVR